MTHLEKIARALYLGRLGLRDKPVPQSVIDAWPSEEASCMSAARAAVEAMRDVDTDVGPSALAAGKQALYSCSEDPELEEARGCFRAMVDAILNEKAK